MIIFVNTMVYRYCLQV